MKKSVAIIIFINLFFHLKSQNFIDFQQNRIDNLDDVLDAKIKDSLTNYCLFPLIDELQLLINESEFDGELKNKIELAIYYDLYGINRDYLGKYAISFDKFYDLRFFLKFIENNTLSNFTSLYPSKVYNILPYINSFSEVEVFLRNEAIHYPEKIFQHFDKFKSSKYAEEVLSLAILKDPLAAKQEVKNNIAFKDFSRNSKNPGVQLFYQIYIDFGSVTKSFVYLDAILNNNKSVEEANVNSKEADDVYFKELIQLSIKENVLAEKSIEKELKNFSIKKIRLINAAYEDHQTPSRFQSLQYYSSLELYFLIVFSEDEIFTSSFNGIFLLFNQKLENEGLNIVEFLDAIKFKHGRTFVKICANYNVLESLISNVLIEQKESFFKNIIYINNESNLIKEATSIANIIGSSNDKEVIRFMGDELLINYTKETDSNRKKIFGLLIQIYTSKDSLENPIFSTISKQFPVYDYFSIDSTKLFGADGIHTQIHFFYDDEDGEISFNNFLSLWNKENWLVQDNNEYVLIQSKSGNKVHILANKPSYEYTAPSRILEFLTEQHQDIEMLVHRGHSFYVSKSLQYLQDKISIVFLGSCGSYNQVADILNKAPNATIFSTKQIGSYTVNNPLIKVLATEIAKNSSINWEVFWKDFSKKFTPNTYAYDKFQEYVPPHLNLGANFIKAYKNCP